VKQDKKQLQQFIALGVLAVSFVGFVSFQVMGTKTPPAVAPGSASTSNGSDGSSSDSGATAGKTELVSDLIAKGVFPGLSKDLPRRDPFILQVMPNSGPTDQVVAPTRVDTMVQANNAPKPDFGNEKIPSINVRPINPFAGGSASPGSARITAVEPERTFTVTGVVRGEHNVAIVYDDKGGRYVVREGELIDGQYSLRSVGREGVVLSHKNRAIHVKIGGAKDAG
jgi:hypothetical protein